MGQVRLYIHVLINTYITSVDDAVIGKSRKGLGRKSYILSTVFVSCIPILPKLD